MLATVAYADIFDYPLTREEVFRWLIKGDSFASGKESPYWNYLPGRARLVKLRDQRQRFSRRKRQWLKRFNFFWRLLPFIKMVGITGALAMNNADENDDIDLMIITQANRLWLSRAIIYLCLWPWLRRGQLVNNRLCLNLWLDESALAIKEQNLYLAHEICQLQPLVNRGDTYRRFLKANIWYKNYLPNWTP